VLILRPAVPAEPSISGSARPGPAAPPKAHILPAMCGFVGYLGAPMAAADLARARDLLRHRGPDGEGLWEDPTGPEAVGLAFRRLAILDLSDAAAQPMALGDLRLVFNGEIYNFVELRSELEALGHRFRSTGDTEVLLAAYRQWGLGAIPRLQGMFALALWDGGRRRLVLARDRVGIKPLYHARHAGRFVFGSEPKAVLEASGKPARLDERSLERFLTFLWVPDPDTMFEGVRKLPPGHLAVIEGAGERIEPYWDMRFEEREGTAEEHAARLREALRTAVRRQLVADVPLGVFLSGGVDSTLIARLAADASDRPVLALATGFEGPAQRNELGESDLPYARLAARAIPGLDYREIVLSEVSAGLADDLAGHFDDPVADPAAIATYLICRAAKPEATVMLSGVGAEELFGGYPRHRVAAAAARLAAVPAPVRSAAARIGGAIPGARPGRGMGRLRHLRKFVHGLGEAEPYVAFCAHHDPRTLERLLGRPVGWDQVTAAHREHLDRAGGLPPLSRALYLDLKTFLPSLNLAYTDRASMACSVEVRVPMLDDLVLEAAAAIPDRMKVGRGGGKLVLKRAARGLVPEEILRRPKTGFGGPVRTWMRTLGSDVIRDCLSEETLRRRGLVRPRAVRDMREQLLRGRSDQALQLWAVVVLELWARRFLDRSAPVPAVTASSP
jgi:asparagine synthase (glutamine-hydrolysing)